MEEQEPFRHQRVFVDPDTLGIAPENFTICEECAGVLHSRAYVCPHCGVPRERGGPGPLWTLIAVLAGLCLWLAFA